jgi:hypothetical protein
MINDATRLVGLWTLAVAGTILALVVGLPALALVVWLALRVARTRDA